MTVFNAEPEAYSEKAIAHWESNGFTYMEGSWELISNTTQFDDVRILIVRLKKKIDQSVFDKFPNLTHLVSATTGLDHIDLTEMRNRNINLLSLRGHDDFLRTIPSTAELTWGLLLALIRHIPSANEHVKSGFWNRDIFRGRQLKGKVLGIVGLGRTGSKIASYARAFDMQVVFYDPYVTVTEYKKCESLSELLQLSDIISLHVHLNDETKNLIGTEQIELVKPGALFINTSRSGVWNEEAIVQGLESKQIAAVATDVLDNELTDIHTGKLWQAQQKGLPIIITPHIGGASQDAMWACEDYVANLYA